MVISHLTCSYLTWGAGRGKVVRTEEISYGGNDEGRDGRGKNKASAIHGMLMVEPVKEIVECACPAMYNKTNSL